jgi:hypothetical protein
MTTLVLAICGPLVVALVIAGMVLITPSGTVRVHAVGEQADGSNLSPVSRSRPEAARPAESS